jgi:hypothetical protein
MLVIEHLKGKQDYELLVLEWWGLIDLGELAAWLKGRETPPMPEPPVEIRDHVWELMQPAGPRGGRLPR